MSPSYIERIKLTANWFNAIAAAAISVGFIAPITALAYLPAAEARSVEIVLFSLLWLLAGIILHLFARGLLDGLDP